MMFAAAACSKKEMIKCQVCGNKPGHSKTYFGKCEDEIDKIDVGEEGTCDRNAKSCMKKVTGKCTQSLIRYRVISVSLLSFVSTFTRQRMEPFIEVAVPMKSREMFVQIKKKPSGIKATEEQYTRM